MAGRWSARQLRDGWREETREDGEKMRRPALTPTHPSLTHTHADTMQTHALGTSVTYLDIQISNNMLSNHVL